MGDSFLAVDRGQAVGRLRALLRPSRRLCGCCRRQTTAIGARASCSDRRSDKVALRARRVLQRRAARYSCASLQLCPGWRGVPLAWRVGARCQRLCCTCQAQLGCRVAWNSSLADRDASLCSCTSVSASLFGSRSMIISTACLQSASTIQHDRPGVVATQPPCRGPGI
jgi:hypothetical protein